MIIKDEAVDCIRSDGEVGADEGGDGPAAFPAIPANNPPSPIPIALPWLPALPCPEGLPTTAAPPDLPVYMASI